MKQTSMPRCYLPELLTTLALALQGCHPVEQVHAAENVTSSGVAVKLAPVAHNPVTRTFERAGILRRKNTVELSFKVGGLVQAVNVEAGARVRKGQVIAVLNPTEIVALHAQAKQVAEKASRDLLRVRVLHAGGSAPLIDVQNAETQAAVAQAVLENAEFQAYHTKLYAPDDGVVDARLIETGEMVAPESPAFRMSGDSRGAVVRVAVTDRDVLMMELGNPASVVLDAMPEKALPAKISEVSTMASPATGMFEVEVQLNRESVARLPSGLTARVSFESTSHPVATVPLNALVDGEGREAAVFVVERGRAKRTPVLVSFLYGNRAALARGLENASEVVEAGSAQLANDALVRVIP